MHRLHWIKAHEPDAGIKPKPKPQCLYEHSLLYATQGLFYGKERYLPKQMDPRRAILLNAIWTTNPRDKSSRHLED